MAMLTVPVMIFVRVGLRIRLEAKPGTRRRLGTNMCRAARAVRQPALLDHLHL
jgi:hypothetical protein